MTKHILAVIVAGFCFFGFVLRVDAQRVTRGPYLQSGTPTSIVVRWRTNEPTDSRVIYGTSLANLTGRIDSQTTTKEHAMHLSGLLADTRYYYAIGSTSTILAGDDAGYFFVTAPGPGTEKPVRVWIVGDSGTADNNARAVRDAYFRYIGHAYTDLWLMLGDNAYPAASDSGYQKAIFDMYPSILRQTVLWPTLGNHDSLSTGSAAQAGPYYDMLTLPRLGEAGGIPSGTEAFYSFEYANIHFICLDSCDSNRSPGGPMLIWLENDLAATTRKWIIAYWHHPPYSKGSHDSDTERRLVEMRENALPILESYKTDLVLSGHSHSYERSFQLYGHYGTSDTLRPDMIVEGGDGPYSKASTGTVYIVAGCSGKVATGPLDHPAMAVSSEHLGSVILEINGNRLDARFINDRGSTKDHLTIVKGVARNQEPTVYAGTDRVVLLPATVSLDGAVTDDGLPDPLGIQLTTWRQVSGPGTVTFSNADEVDTAVSLSEAGTYVLSLTVNDGAFSASDDVVIIAKQGSPRTLEIQVADHADDAEERSSGSTNLSSADLEFVYDGGNQTVGLRFNALTIPQGAAIYNAYVQFKADETNSDAASLTITAEDRDDAPTFSAANRNISSRMRTTASVSWSPAPWTTVGQAGPDQRTPNIASVVQEVVSRPGWSSGDSLVIIVTGTGARTAESHDRNPAGAPLLHVEYTL